MILVTGARGVVGTPLCQQLSAQNAAYIQASRSPHAGKKTIEWDMSAQPQKETFERLSACEVLIHCAPIWLLPDQLPGLKNTNIRRLIVFSSTSVLSKQTSQDASELQLVRSLAESEQAIQDYCREQGLALTILRPSMIYGFGLDQNIMHIARFIKRWGFMVLVGRAYGQRQPVHSNDLVSACLAIIDASQTYSKAYNLAGGEVLSYQQMVERIFVGLEKKPRFLRAPLWLFKLALKCASLITKFSYTSEMATRMNQDLVYDNGPAKLDFGYQPERFLQLPERDLRFDP